MTLYLHFSYFDMEMIRHLLPLTTPPSLPTPCHHLGRASLLTLMLVEMDTICSFIML